MSAEGENLGFSSPHIHYTHDLYPPQLIPPDDFGLTSNRKIHLMDGYPVETDSQVRILTGPVVGKVTAHEAVILIEVLGTESQKFVPIQCALYRELEGPEVGQPAFVLAKDCRARRATVFHFQVR